MSFNRHLQGRTVIWFRNGWRGGRGSITSAGFVERRLIGRSRIRMHRRADDASHTRETSNLPLGPTVVCNHVHTNVGVPIDDSRHCQRGTMTFPFVYAIRRTSDKSPWILTRLRAGFAASSYTGCSERIANSPNRQREAWWERVVGKLREAIADWGVVSNRHIIKSY